MGWRRTARRHAAPASHEQGFTLIEVVVATMVLLVILVPTAYVISTSDTLLTTNRSKTVAVNLATSQLDEDRSVADAQTWSTTACSSAPSGVCAAPDLPAVTASRSVGDTVYATSQSVGWCAEKGISGPWANYTSSPTNPAGYGVLVKVSWEGGSVSAGTVLMTPSSQWGDVPADSSSGCPL